MGKENLDAFEGFGIKEDIDFFGDSLTEEEKTDQGIIIEDEDKPEDKKEETPEDKEEIEKSKKDGEEGNEIAELFNELEGKETPKETDEEKETEEEKKFSKKVDAVSSLNFLKDRGLIDYELEDDVELTEELAEEILEDDFDSRVESRIEELFETQHPMLKQLNKFAADGGDVERFFSQLSKGSDIPKNLDISKEADQVEIVKRGLTNEGYDTEYIETQISMLKDSGKLEKYAKVHDQKFKEKEQEEKAAMLKQARLEKERRKESRRRSKQLVKEYLSETEEVKGLKVTRADKNNLPSYISDESVRLQDGGTITPLRADLIDAMADKEKVIVLAKLLKSNFNLEKFMKSAETKATKTIKDDIKRTKNKIPSQSANKSSQGKKTLADFF